MFSSEGTAINFKYRMYDPRIGRFFATDPLQASFPWNSPYAFATNNPIMFIDPDGRTVVPVIVDEKKRKKYNATLKQMKSYTILDINYSKLASFHNMPNAKEKKKSKAMTFHLEVTVRDMSQQELVATNGQGIGFSTRISSQTKTTEGAGYLIHEYYTTEIALSDKGMTYGVIAEEFLHAGQKMFYHENNVTVNSISLELEAKLIKVYAVWGENKDMSAKDLYTELVSKGVQLYEMDILFDFDYDKAGNPTKLKGFDQDVLTLFKGEDSFSNYGAIDRALQKAGQVIESVYKNIPGWNANESIDTGFDYFENLQNEETKKNKSQETGN